ncbi:unnamed protein product, partial [Ectocarpus sp. 6 AP-2014]
MAVGVLSNVNVERSNGKPGISYYSVRHRVHTTSQPARAMSKPGKVHMGAAKHLLRYLAGTTDFSITH